MVDIVGCGDSFVVVIVLGYICNMLFVNILMIVNVVGVVIVMGCGVGRNVVKRYYVVDFIKVLKFNDEESLLKELFVENLEIFKVNFFLKGMRKEGSNK